MPSVPAPPPHHGVDHASLDCVDRPGPDEVHVLLLGLDGIAASVAVHLLRCGVLSLNVNDPAPVTAAGVYRRADVGRPREAVLRRRLRELDPRCVPVTGPKLFPGTLLPATLVVRSAGHTSPAGAGSRTRTNRGAGAGSIRVIRSCPSTGSTRRSCAGPSSRGLTGRASTACGPPWGAGRPQRPARRALPSWAPGRDRPTRPRWRPG